MISGAKWWKFDFHAHTPASADYREPGISCREYLLSTMEKKIDCLAVTDHDSCLWIDLLQRELSALRAEKPVGYRELVIFPGVEVEVFSSVHLLALFDPNKPTAEISETISLIRNAGDPKKINEAINIVQKKKGIAIPAHVDATKGLFTEIQGSALKSTFDNCDFCAVEVTHKDYCIPQLCIENKKEFTFVMGSDAHRREDIGRRFSWVKMEYPTIESLALALYDGTDGVIVDGSSVENPNFIDNRCYIEELTILNGQKIGNGTPFSIRFSPWLNTLIGGRGSGKTAIIEFIRIVFDKSENLPNGMLETYRKFKRVPRDRSDVGMLRASTRIEAIITKDRRRLKLTWENDEWEEFECTGSDWVKNESVGNVKRRFPVNIYSQKQLYEMAEDPKCLIRYIDSMFDYDSWHRKLEDLVRDYKDSCAQARELTAKLSREDAVKAQLHDLNAKIKLLEETASDPAIKEMQLLLSKHGDYISELTGVSNYLAEICHKKVISKPLNHSNYKDILSERSLVECERISCELEEIARNYNELQDRIAALVGATMAMIRSCEMSTAYTEAETGYIAKIATLAQNGVSQIDELPSLYSSKRSLDDELDDMVSSEKRLSEVNTIIGRLLNEIVDHNKNLRGTRSEIIGRLNSDYIKISLMPMSDHELAETEFRNIIRKESQFQADIFDEDNVRDSFIGKICNSASDPWKNRETVITDLLKAEYRESTYGKRFSDYISALCAEHSEDIDMLRIWCPPDTVQLEILIDGRFTNIEKGSAGQKTTGLLSLILRSNSGPILIDQPEDDLDTKLISDMLVEEIRNIKVSNQIVVVTHNPNIPVNGAAEQVLAMGYVSGQISCKHEGALQDQKIRNEICDVMEGGRDALKKRYFRIYKPLYS